MRFIVLSGMNPQMYKSVWPEDTDDDGKIDWITPSNEEEAEDLERLFAELDSLSGSEENLGAQ